MRRTGWGSNLTRLLLGMGLRTFSMHPAQILEVKSRVLKSDVSRSHRRCKMLRLEEPAKSASSWSDSTAPRFDNPAGLRLTALKAPI